MYCNMDFFTLNMEYLPPRPLQEPNIEQHLCGYSISNTLPFISVEILISSLQASTSPRPPTHRTTLAGASNCLSHPSHPFRAAEAPPPKTPHRSVGERSNHKLLTPVTYHLSSHTKLSLSLSSIRLSASTLLPEKKRSSPVASVGPGGSSSGSGGLSWSSGKDGKVGGVGWFVRMELSGNGANPGVTVVPHS